METLIQFIQRQPSGYQAQLKEYMHLNYSEFTSLMDRVRKWIKQDAPEVESIMRAISLLESKPYDLTMFQWVN